MEYGLGHLIYVQHKGDKGGLNPCFNGIWSRTYTGTPRDTVADLAS